MRLAALILLASTAFGQDQVVVHAIRFADFKKVSAAEILDRLNEREVRLEVSKPYRPEDAEEARRYIAQLLAEKGRRHARIEIVTTAVAPRSVDVQFRLLK
jgi:hypothetical protein